MTREEAITKHRALWHAIAKEIETNPDECANGSIVNIKEAVLAKVFPEDKHSINNDCYLCQYNYEKYLEDDSKHETLCDFCPLTNNPFKCLDGLYVKAARAIADGRLSDALIFATMVAEKEEVSK